MSLRVLRSHPVLPSVWAKFISIPIITNYISQQFPRSLQFAPQVNNLQSAICSISSYLALSNVILTIRCKNKTFRSLFFSSRFQSRHTGTLGHPCIHFAVNNCQSTKKSQRPYLTIQGWSKQQSVPYWLTPEIWHPTQGKNKSYKNRQWVKLFSFLKHCTLMDSSVWTDHLSFT